MEPTEPRPDESDDELIVPSPDRILEPPPGYDPVAPLEAELSPGDIISVVARHCGTNLADVESPYRHSGPVERARNVAMAVLRKLVPDLDDSAIARRVGLTHPGQVSQRLDNATGSSTQNRHREDVAAVLAFLADPASRDAPPVVTVPMETILQVVAHQYQTDSKTLLGVKDAIRLRPARLLLHGLLDKLTGLSQQRLAERLGRTSDRVGQRMKEFAAELANPEFAATFEAMVTQLTAQPPDTPHERSSAIVDQPSKPR